MDRLRRDGGGRNDFAFFVRLARRCGLDCALFGRQRIDLGAYEAAFLADVYFCCRAELFVSRQGEFLVRQVARDPFRACADTHNFLHLQRSDRQVSRLAEYRDLFHIRRGDLRLRDAAVQLRKSEMQGTKTRICRALRDRVAFRHFHFQNARARDFSRSADGNLRVIKCRMDTPSCQTIDKPIQSDSDCQIAQTIDKRLC